MIAEGLGGLLLIVGLFTWYVTLPLIAIMIGAIWLIKVHVGFVVQGAAGADLETALLAGLLGLLFTGPGRLSLDSMLGRPVSGRAPPPWQRSPRRCLSLQFSGLLLPRI